MAVHCSWKLNSQLIFYSHILLKYYYLYFFFLPDSQFRCLTFLSTLHLSHLSLNSHNSHLSLSTFTSTEIHHPLNVTSLPPKLNSHQFTPLPHAADPSLLSDPSQPLFFVWVPISSKLACWFIGELSLSSSCNAWNFLFE